MNSKLKYVKTLVVAPGYGWRRSLPAISDSAIRDELVSLIATAKLEAFGESGPCIHASPVAAVVDEFFKVADEIRPYYALKSI